MSIIKKAIYKCKNCENVMLDYPQLSGNNFGAKVYSDLFLDGDMIIPFDNNYVVCSRCKKVYERDEIFLRFIDRDNRDNEDELNYPIRGLDKIEAIIKSDNSNIERENILLWYLWHINHYSYKEEIQKEKNLGNYDRYTEELLKILNKKNDQSSVILYAEILREKNHFDQAIDILLSTNFEENLKKRAKQILDKALKKESDIFVI